MIMNHITVMALKQNITFSGHTDLGGGHLVRVILLRDILGVRGFSLPYRNACKTVSLEA